MSKISQEYPFLNHLEDKTTLNESPFARKMNAKFIQWLNARHNEPISLYSGYVIGLGHDDDDYLMQLSLVMATINENWSRIMSKFRTNVALVSGPFMAAGKHAAEAFNKDPVATSSFLAGKTFSETVLVSSTQNTVGYSLRYDDQGTLIDYCILWLDHFGTVFGYIVPGIQFLSRSILRDDKNGLKPRPMLLLDDSPLHSLSKRIINTVNYFLLFCHFAEITDEFVARPGSRQAREQDGSGETFVNDTRYNVRRLSVTYYKNICRDEGFPVRGHFRMQPYGVGRTHRRLIYVNSFVKHGYHRRAGKLTVGEFDRDIN